jgi:hypothetical protein
MVDANSTHARRTCTHELPARLSEIADPPHGWQLGCSDSVTPPAVRRVSHAGTVALAAELRKGGGA